MTKICLSLNEKIKVIEESEKGNSVKSLMNTFKCRKTQIYNIIKNKIKIREEWLKGKSYSLILLGNGKSKRSLKKTVNDEINKAVWNWFVKARSKNIPISGPMLQEKSKDIAIKLGNTDLKGSNGWLECFRKRHNISWNQVCGESNDVNVDEVNKWKSKIALFLQKH
ncbi:tigger transposable element-derived protein 7-like [Sipha flava]|uniref:Tigger transposable element-derived protein 7-like n=1 Tax=Sipha flava TaxID=143950 RepID=A0A8B8GQ30_9HEMI|nr:tigger transposable element-derived protein 7-like [Sipha flava]